MNRPLAVLALALLAACSSTPETPKETPPAEKPKETPPAAKALPSGLDLANGDPKVRPQDDLFRAVNGTWLAKFEIPRDRSSHGAFAELGEKSEAHVKAILEELAKGDAAPGTEARKIGDFYASYLDDQKVEALGLAPIQDDLAAIDAIASKADLVKRLAALRPLGVGGAFRLYVMADPKASSQHVLSISQDGLGLPDRGYYLDERYAAKRGAYGPHVAKTLELAGVAGASELGPKIVALETALAKAHWTKEDSRDSTKTYNRKTLAELEALAPGIDWRAYFAAVGLEQATEVVVAQPSYFEALAKLLDEEPLAAWKGWLAWRLIHHHADHLPRAIADASFAFYGTALRGTPEQRVRWKRAVASVQGAMGEAVGRVYVERHFPPEARARMETLVENVIAAYRERLERLEWMGKETRARALEKLSTFLPKIGHPKKWRDYSALEVVRDDLLGNVRRASAHEWKRQSSKLGKPVDREEWHMTPQTVNAYYSSSQNEIVFPAAILNPPFFDRAADDAVNYGGIGAVIGHEIGHGFDDQGSKWDARGNLADWWTKADRAEFDERAGALAAQYDAFEPLPGFHVNGRLTLGENIGDLAGVTVAHAAYRRSLGGKEAPTLDGLTGDQRFFYGFARVWRGKHRDDDLKVRLQTDPHSPGELRANGTVRNVPAFHEAFKTKPGDKLWLAPEQRVRIW